MVIGDPCEGSLTPKGLATHRLRTTDLADELLAYRWQFVCDAEITLDCVGSHFLPTMAYPIAHAPSHLSTQSSTDISYRIPLPPPKCASFPDRALFVLGFLHAFARASFPGEFTHSHGIPCHLIHSCCNDLLCWVCTGCAIIATQIRYFEIAK